MGKQSTLRPHLGGGGIEPQALHAVARSLRVRQAVAASNALEEFRDGHLEADGQDFNRADTGLLAPVLQLADVDAPKP